LSGSVSNGTNPDSATVSNSPEAEDSAADAAELETLHRNSNRRQLIEAELLRDPTRTNGAIGDHIGCSDEMVRKVRKELEGAGRLQQVAVVRRDGSVYPTRDVPSVGHAPEPPVANPDSER